MAEHSSVNSHASDLSSDIEFIGSDTVTVVGHLPANCESALNEDTNNLLHALEKSGNMPSKPNQAESEKANSSQSDEKYVSQFTDYGNISRYYELTSEGQFRLIEVDIDEFEKELCSLNLDTISEVDPAQKADNIMSLQNKVTNFVKMLEKPKNSAEDTEPDLSIGAEEQMKEKLTEFKYEEKNKLMNRQSLEKICKEFFQGKFKEINFAEEKLKNLSIDFELHPAINVLRRIAYPKICEKHFLPEFPTSAATEEDEPVENICINMEHYEFLHEKKNFLELFEIDDNFDWEQSPEINNIVPTFVEFLESLYPQSVSESSSPQSVSESLSPQSVSESPSPRSVSESPSPQSVSESPSPESICQSPSHEKCFSIILSILQNPYRKLEFFFINDELPVVKEQIAIAKYLMNCLQNFDILDDEAVYEKLAETIIKFAGIHASFLAQILAGFRYLLSEPENNKYTYRIYCNVLHIMTSIGAIIIDLSLPEYFEKICLAAYDGTCDLYFHLLRACEISVADILENKFQIKSGSPDEIDLDTFYTSCYNYFSSALTIRLIPAFKKYEKRKDREEQYFSKTHSIFPTKDGYMNTEMRFLINMNKSTSVPDSGRKKGPSRPAVVKNCTFNSAGKVLFSVSNNQLGCIIQEQMSGLSNEDTDYKYWNFLNQFPLYVLKSVTDLIKCDQGRVVRRQIG